MPLSKAGLQAAFAGARGGRVAKDQVLKDGAVYRRTMYQGDKKSRLMQALRKNVNRVFREYSHMRPTDWKCNICGEINYRHRDTCYACKTDKEVAIMDLPTPEELSGEWEVRNSGSLICNGVYQHEGINDGVKRYVNHGTDVELLRSTHPSNGSRFWVMRQVGDDTAYYYNTSTASQPPNSGWQKGSGNDPNPVVKKFDPLKSYFVKPKALQEQDKKARGPGRLNSYLTSTRPPESVNDWLDLPIKWILGRCGNRFLQGRYREYGYSDDIPKYAFRNMGQEFEIARIDGGQEGGKYWVIRQAGSEEVYYFATKSGENPNLPPEKGWQADKGANPAPILRFVSDEEEEVKVERKPGKIYENDSMRLQGLMSEETLKYNNKNCIIKRVLGNGRYDVTVVPIGTVLTVQEHNLESIVEEGFSQGAIVDVRVEDRKFKNNWLTATIEKVRNDTTVDVRIEESKLAIELGCVGQKCRKEPIANVRIKLREGQKVEITGGIDDTWVGQRATIEKYLDKKRKWGLRLKSGKRIAIHEDNFMVLKGAMMYETALPPGWETFYDDIGRVYYVNRSLNISQWDVPET